MSEIKASLMSSMSANRSVKGMSTMAHTLVVMYAMLYVMAILQATGRGIGIRPGL